MSDDINSLKNLDVDKIKNDVSNLIEKYEKFSKSNKLKELKEEETKKDFILPLFGALGWDVYNSEEVSAEESISGKRVDHGFRIANIPQFYLEAKSFKEGVERDDFAFQAINYAYNKGCNWAILTNFEKIRIFNAQKKTKLAYSAQFMTLNCTNFLEEFDKLLLLSKDAFKQNLLDLHAEKYGKQIKKIPIDKQLLNDMTKFRGVLTHDATRLNKNLNLSKYELDESIQKILDRLIFIRTVEDRKIEPIQLKPLFVDNQQRKLYELINEIFRKFDSDFNSGLFSSHLCEKLILSDKSLEEVLRGLYQTEDQIILYDFSAIDADILGAMYEQYLGYISKEDKFSDFKNGSKKRKEEGIYYTPKYVVDYIIQNTLGKYVKENPTTYNKVKIIDPASGSGSFLLQALNHLVLIDKDLQHSNKIKDKINDGESIWKNTWDTIKQFNYMKNSIFGVDQDQTASEITKLNLLLYLTQKKEKLPILRKNIRIGNSLITKKDYSENFFHWESKFPDVFNEGGFDVVIGNPPYFNLQTLHDENYKEGLKQEFSEIYTGQNDILYFFYYLGTKILKKNGYLGLITSRYFLEADFASKLRKFLKLNIELDQIIDFGSKVRIFEDASINTCIIIFRNQKNEKQDNIVKIVKVKDWTENNISLFDFIKNNIDKTIKNKSIEVFQKPQKEISDYKWTLQSQETTSIVNTLQKNSKHLGNFEGKDGVCKVFKSIESGLDSIKINNKIIGVFRLTKEEVKNKKLEKSLLKPLIKNGMIRRYQINYNDEYLIFTTNNTNIDNFPNVKKHLLEFETELKDRYDYKKGNFNFFRLSNLRNINLLTSNNDKLFVPMIAPENRFVYVKSNNFVCAADVYVVLLQDKNFNLRYVQGVLNSKLMNCLVKRNSKAVDGAAKTSSGETKRRYSYSVKNISNLPIKKASQTQQNSVAKLVEEIETLYNNLKLYKDKETERKKQIEEEISLVDSKIDTLVNEIYGVTEDDIVEFLM